MKSKFFGSEEYYIDRVAGLNSEGDQLCGDHGETLELGNARLREVLRAERSMRHRQRPAQE